MTTTDLVLMLLTGVGATALIDLWAIARKSAFAIPLPNYALVGRWIAHLARGRLRHDSIAAAPPIRAERAIGWSAHYAIGASFAGLLPAFWGAEWIRHPTLAPALIVGLTTVVMPFLVMQPGMGAGIAARRTPRPAAARFQSMVTHAMFGFDLYVAGKIVSLFSNGG